jgi:hypothetical protein
MTDIEKALVEITARVRHSKVMICEGQGDPSGGDGCGGQGGNLEGVCSCCLGVGLMTPQLQTAIEAGRSWRRVAERLEGEIQDLLHACDCEIRDMTNNRNDPDKRSAAYAEGALRVAKGIAHRIREKSAAR